MIYSCVKDYGQSYLTFRHACDYSQWKTKSKKIWPIGLHQVEPLVQFNSLRKPFIFETVERVKQTLVDQIEGSAQELDRNKGKHLPL